MDEARGRSKLIRSVQYALNVVLPRGNSYCGSVEIKFALAKPGHIFLDYGGSDVGDVVINGVRTPAEKVFSEHQITVPEELLQKGNNIVFAACPHDE